MRGLQCRGSRVLLIVSKRDTEKGPEYLNFSIDAGTTGGRTARAPMDDPIRNTGAPLQLAWQNGSRTFLTCVSASLTTFENLLMAWRGSGGWGSLSPCPAASKLSVAMFSAARYLKTAPSATQFNSKSSSWLRGVDVHARDDGSNHGLRTDVVTAGQSNLLSFLRA